MEIPRSQATQTDILACLSKWLLHIDNITINTIYKQLHKELQKQKFSDTDPSQFN